MLSVHIILSDCPIETNQNQTTIQEIAAKRNENHGNEDFIMQNAVKR